MPYWGEETWTPPKGKKARGVIPPRPPKKLKRRK